MRDRLAAALARTFKQPRPMPLASVALLGPLAPPYPLLKRGGEGNSRASAVHLPAAGAFLSTRKFEVTFRQVQTLFKYVADLF